MKPLVSVITVSRNSGRFIEDNILSVMNQDYHNIEHIVVDGGSTDGTVGILRRHKTVKWISEPDGGVTDAFNKGIGRARGGILAFLNSDDTYYGRDAVSKAVDAMEVDSKAGVVFGDCAYIDVDGRTTGFIRGQGKRFSYLALLCSEFSIPLPSAFVRRSAVDAIGGKLDTIFDFAADWELWVRIGLEFPIAYVPETFGCAREYYGAMQTTLRCATENPTKRRLVLISVFTRPELPPELKALRRRAYAGTYVTEAMLLFGAGQKQRAMECIYQAVRLYPFCLLAFRSYILSRRFLPFLMKAIDGVRSD